MSEKELEALKKQNLLPKIKGTLINPCDHCLIGKQHRTSFASTSTRKTGLLELVHTDVGGPMEVKSLVGSIYFVTFIDDHTRVYWVYLMKEKLEVELVFKNFSNMIENQFHTRI